MSGFRFRLLAVAAPLALALIASPALAQGTPWHLDAIDQRSLPYDDTYNPNGTGSGVSVYILGSGLNHNHVDFQGRVQTSWSAFANPDDELGHGTWVASLVGGDTYGVAKSVALHGVKVIDGCGTVNPADIVAGPDTAAAAAIVAGAIAMHGSQSAMMAAATSMGVWLRVYV